jgi:hypothetical protein
MARNLYGFCIHIAFGCVQEETFSRAPDVVASGVYAPSHMFIRCMLYHCLIPSSPESLSATSPITPSSSLLIPPPIELRLSWAIMSKIDPKDGAVGVESEGEVVAGIML